MKNLFTDLKNAQTEEEVKFLFAKFFNLKISTKNYIDLYTPQILFEFKFDADLNNVQSRAKIFLSPENLAHSKSSRTNKRLVSAVL